MRGCSKSGMGFIFRGVVGLVFFGFSAQAAVLIEEGSPVRENQRIESDVQEEAEWNRPGSGREAPSRTPAEPADSAPRETRRKVRRQNSPQIGRGDNRMENPYTDIADLRRTRRVGVGASFLGRAGFIGLDAELNLVPNHSFLASLGGGPGYTGVSMGYKWTPFTSRWHPSFSMAMASWTSESENFRDGATLPSFFRPKSGQASDPRLRAIYLIPAIGIQSLQIRGPGVGGMIFAEALLFTDASTFAVQPLGSVGAKYFF